jgi:ankyrin repeat protein
MTIDSFQTSTLHEACRKGRLEVVSLLLDYGADVNPVSHARVSFISMLLTQWQKCEHCDLIFLSHLQTRSHIISASHRMRE